MNEGTEPAHRIKKESIWTGQFILILLIALLMNFSNFLIGQTLPLYVKQIGGNNSTVGLLTTLFSVVAMVFRPIFGNMMDTRSRRMVLAIGFVVMAGAAFSYGFVSTIGMLLILRAFNGIGFSALTSTGPTVVSDIIPMSKLADGISKFGISGTIATAIAPFLAVTIYRNFGFGILTIIATAICLIGLLLVMPLNYEKKNPRQKNPGKLRLSNLFEKSAIRPSIVQFLVGVTVASVFTFIPVYGVAVGISNTGLFFTIYSIALFLTTPFVGRLILRFGNGKVFVSSVLLLTSSYLVLAFIPSVLGMLIGAVLFGLGSGGTFPVLNVIVLKLCAPERRGAANGTLFAAMDIGIGVGAYIMGAVSEKGGFLAMYLVAAGISLVIIGSFYALLHGRINEK